MEQDPYIALGLGRDADEAAIRARYLELVREFPPEREPVKAAEIRAAYDVLRDPVQRLKKQLLDIRPTCTLDELVIEQKKRCRGTRLPTQVLLSLGQS